MISVTLILQEKEAYCIDKLRHWMKVQESVYKQKARIDWIKLGDANTHYFFAAMQQRYSRNRIESIYTYSDMLLQDPDQVAGEIKNFYITLLGTKAECLQGGGFGYN